MTPLKTQAIQKAFDGNWSAAVLINQEILKDNPNDIETLNRLALALTLCGKIKQAKTMYQKVLELDNQNPIAIKNVKRLGIFTSKKKAIESAPTLTKEIATMFLEESGKTKIIELVNTAEPKIISLLMTGEALVLQIKRLKIFILDTKKHYIGVLPDDIGKRLIKLIKGGNVYEAYIKAIGNHRVAIFIREIKRSTRYKNQSSFISADKTKISLRKSHSKDAEEEDESDAESSNGE